MEHRREVAAHKATKGVLNVVHVIALVLLVLLIGSVSPVVVCAEVGSCVTRRPSASIFHFPHSVAAAGHDRGRNTGSRLLASMSQPRGVAPLCIEGLRLAGTRPFKKVFTEVVRRTPKSSGVRS